MPSACPARTHRHGPCSGCGSLRVEASRGIQWRGPADREPCRGRLHVATSDSHRGVWYRSRRVKRRMRRSLAYLASVLMMAACAAPQLGSTPTASSVAVQPGAAPKTMHRCAISGDINAYLDSLKGKDPTTYKST